MVRNMELVKAILLFVEQNQVDDSVSVEVEGYSENEIAYHIAILSEAGLLKPNPDFDASRVSLTWAGHELLAKLNTPVSFG